MHFEDENRLSKYTKNISGCLHNGSSPKLFIHTCNRSSIIYKLNPLTSQCLYSSLYASYSSFICLILLTRDWSLRVNNQNFIIGQAIKVIDEEVDLILQSRSVIFVFLFYCLYQILYF